MSITDKAAHVCPVGAIIVKRTAYQSPIGQRIFDREDIAEVALVHEQTLTGGEHG